MKKILFTVLLISSTILLACNNGGGGGEPCCTGGPVDQDCNGKCDRCGLSTDAASFDTPCGTAHIKAEAKAEVG